MGPHAVVRARALLETGWLLFLRDFRYRYRRAYLSYLWVFGRVLFMAVPLILVGRQFGLGGGRTGVPYEVFAIVGVVLWQVFWDALYYPLWLARRVRSIVATVVFPHEAILVASCAYVCLNASLYSLLVVVAFALFGVVPGPSLLLGIAAVPLLILAGLSLGIYFVPVSFVYFDFRYGLPFLASALLWTAPVFYAMPDAGLLRTINVWNPLTYLIEVPRRWLVAESSPEDVVFLLPIAAACLFLWLGLKVYRHGMPLAIEIIDR